jgi:hypothetical protein
MRPGKADRLIWKPVKRGTYTVKQGYQKLADTEFTGRSQDKVWEVIWSLKNVLPKVKIFL